jgi:phage head maturation protease
VLILAARQDITKSSFAFRVGSMPGDQQWFNSKGQEVPQWSGDAVKRVINRVAELADCSPVTSPAYEGSSVSARSLYLFPEGRGTCGTNARTEAARQLARSKYRLAVSQSTERSHSNAKHDLALQQILLIRSQLL